jgi:hypothetical protein
MSPKIVCGQAGVPAETCHKCPYVNHESAARGKGQCVHLHGRIGMVLCPECTARAGERREVPLHGCAVHQTCTIARAAVDHYCCDTCNDHKPAWRRDQAGAIRHLTYHVYPRGEIWRWNIAQLKERLSLFNGRRLVGVACDGHSDPLEAVQEALGDPSIEVFHIANDGHRREMTTHPWLLERMSDLVSPMDATFYGHAKGIGSSLIADGVRTWADAMYVSCLDYWPAVRAALVDHAAVGILRRRTRHPPGVPVAWHYSGSFRWLRNADLYRRDWRRIDQEWQGPETYPGLHIGYEESACLWGEHASGMHGYSLAEWTAGWRGPAFGQWQAQHVVDRQPPLLLSVVIRGHAHPERVHEAIDSVRVQTSDSWECLILDSGRIAATGAYDRYREDARIRVVLDPEGPPAGDEPSRAARRLNDVLGTGVIRGDLVMHLPDDDVLAPNVAATMLARARAQPGESAWYGRILRERHHANGRVEQLGGRNTVGILRPGNSGVGRIDGMQVCYRRNVSRFWSEDRAVERYADGVWMDAIAARTPIIPLDLVIGTQRHTPASTYTQ